MAGAAGAPTPEPVPLASARAYGTAVAVTVLAILSQYFVPQHVALLAPVYGSLAGGLAIVYGIPLVAFGVLVGRAPLERWAAQPRTAVWEGLRWYALLTLLSLFVVAILVSIYLRFEPHVVQLLSKPNPVLQAAASNVWFWVGFSFVIGAVEEVIFRGYVFGYWLKRDPGGWKLHAIWTSLLFAGVHLYYGTTYGSVAPIIYSELFLLGLAFAGAMRASGGNLWMIAFLHGAHDAAAFLSLVSTPAALGAEYSLVAVGAVIALIDLLESSSPSAPARPPPTEDALSGWREGSPAAAPWFPPEPSAPVPPPPSAPPGGGPPAASSAPPR